MCSSFQQLISRQQCAKHKGNKIFSFRGLKIPFKFMSLLVKNLKKINWEWNFKEKKPFNSGLFLLIIYLFVCLFMIRVSDHSLDHWISSYIKYFQWTENASLSYFCVRFTHHQNTSSVTPSCYRGAAQLSPKPLSSPAALWSQRKTQRDLKGEWEGRAWDSSGQRFWKRKVRKSRTGRVFHQVEMRSILLLSLIP